MPSLIRFMFFLAVIAIVVLACMYTLDFFVEPKAKQVRVKVSTQHLDIE